jgi:hypothetical protein
MTASQQDLLGRRGLTLMELMVAAFLFLMLTLVLARFLGFSARGNLMMNNRAVLHAEVSRATAWLVSDLEASSVAYSLPVPQGSATDPFIYGTVRTAGANALGALSWEEQFTVYHWVPASQTLSRLVGASGTGWSPDLPLIPTPTLLFDVVAGPTSRRTLSTHVTDFEVTLDPGALVTFRMELQGPEKRPILVQRTCRAKN